MRLPVVVKMAFGRVHALQSYHVVALGGEFLVVDAPSRLE